MTTLIVVRHGQSQSNLDRRFTGQLETPLTELGHLQAEATATLLANTKIDAIYSSDLSRAIETAKHTAHGRGLPIIQRPALREVNAGAWEGKLYDELRAQFGEGYERWIKDIGHAHPDGGESVLELYARVNAEVDRIVAENPGNCVAIFTHATPVRMLACRWFGIPPERAAEVPFCTNASVSTVEYLGNGKTQLLRYGYDAHQGEHTTNLPRGLV